MSTSQHRADVLIKQLNSKQQQSKVPITTSSTNTTTRKVIAQGKANGPLLPPESVDGIMPSSDPILPTVSVGNQDEIMKWNGWGYYDTGFVLKKDGNVFVTGDHYPDAGFDMPALREFMIDSAGIDFSSTTPAQPFENTFIPEPIRNEPFIRQLFSSGVRDISFTSSVRHFHSHGHSCQEIFNLRFGDLPRIVDAVVFPHSHEEVENIVTAAQENGVVIIPYGGGTNVSQALMCPENEQRMIISLAMRKMNRLLWLDKTNMMACFEAGIIGQDIEKVLNREGLTMGHEPDSIEFSALGGWIATRASGMKKNRYGNIEDIIISIKMVSPKGLIEKGCRVPRVSMGPDVHEMILGSEGMIGVVTEAVCKIRPLPECQRFGSLVFPDFSHGLAFQREVAFLRVAPVSIRLMDNKQFRFGLALKPTSAWLHSVIDKAKKWYLIHHLGFVPENMVAVTLLYEGTKEEVERHENLINNIAAKHGGLPAGSENGQRGYRLTFMIAYIRDFVMQYNYVAESFETSVPWDQVESLVHNVTDRIYRECKINGVQSEPFVTYRVTQLYDTGVCVYFYFGFSSRGLSDPLKTYSDVEDAARFEVLSNGGSLSHHHGVGKLRKRFMNETQTDIANNMFRAVKEYIDPDNVFAAGNII